MGPSHFKNTQHMRSYMLDVISRHKERMSSTALNESQADTDTLLLQGLGEVVLALRAEWNSVVAFELMLHQVLPGVVLSSEVLDYISQLAASGEGDTERLNSTHLDDILRLVMSGAPDSSAENKINNLNRINR